MMRTMDTRLPLEFCKLTPQVSSISERRCPFEVTPVDTLEGWVTSYLTLIPSYRPTRSTLSSDFLWQSCPLVSFYLTRQMTIYHTIHPRSSNSGCHPSAFAHYISIALALCLLIAFSSRVVDYDAIIHRLYLTQRFQSAYPNRRPPVIMLIHVVSPLPPQYYSVTVWLLYYVANSLGNQT
ncbi:hypothetical protein EDC04DRAFT_1392413 [Pisolithus marmoratus]|nr:hypothetical protein EDC04DRAFT_1392413 [Pisolithus marmoratus]